MNRLGLKNLLILAVVLLVGFSVSIASYILFQQEKEALTEEIIKENEHFVDGQSAIIETLINEKFQAVDKLADQLKQEDIQKALGDAQNIVKQTHRYASAMNLGSFILAFDNGDAYWNAATSSSSWTDNKYNGDVTQLG